MSNKTNPTTVNTTEKSLQILDFITSRGSTGATTGDIHEEFDFAKSTIHAHLTTLEQHGYLVRKNARYKVGMRCIELSEAARTRNPNFQLAESMVDELESHTASEAEFLVEENGRLVLVFHSEGSVFDRQTEPYMYLHNTAAGKAILAELPEDHVKQVVDKWGLPKQTQNTITNRDQLFEALDEIRDRGYAYNNEEWFEGYHGIGCSVQDIDGSIFGALTVGGPIYRLSEEELRRELADILLQKAEALEEQIHDRGIRHLTE